MYPNSIKKLIEYLKDFPGIGEKSAERLAFSMINFDKERLQSFAETILEIKNKIRKCNICHNISEGDVCAICNDKGRNTDIIFVVEKAKDIIAFEKIGVYNGKYHVLDGLISPLEGINPENINVGDLIKRIENEDVKEIILALKPSIEGETTMQYIKKILGGKKIKVSKIAIGIPIGTDLEYLDIMTLEMALEERKDIS